MTIPRRPLTLRGRLVAALLVFSAVGLVVFGGASVLLLRYSLLNQVDQRLSHTSDHLAATRRSPDRIAERRPRERPPSDYLITIVGPNGPEKIGQQPDQSGGPVLNLATVVRHASSPFTAPDRAGGSAWRVRAVELRDHRIAAVAVSLGSSVEILRLLLIIEAVVGGIVLALIGLVATVAVRSPSVGGRRRQGRPRELVFCKSAVFSVGDRLALVRMVSASLVQVKGWQRSFQLSMKVRMAVMRAQLH